MAGDGLVNDYTVSCCPGPAFLLFGQSPDERSHLEATVSVGDNPEKWWRSSRL